MDDKDQIRLLNLVRRAVVEAPEADTRGIHERAVERYPWVKDMDLRRFYGRYVLKAKKEAGQWVRRKASPTASATARPKPASPKTSSTKKGTSQAPKPQKPATTPRRTRPPPPDEPRDRGEVRRAFVEFAQEMVAADSDPEIIEVIRHLPDYVDRVMRA